MCKYPDYSNISSDEARIAQRLLIEHHHPSDDQEINHMHRLMHHFIYDKYNILSYTKYLLHFVQNK